jgi:hypothetical protein
MMYCHIALSILGTNFGMMTKVGKAKQQKLETTIPTKKG